MASGSGFDPTDAISYVYVLLLSALRPQNQTTPESPRTICPFAFLFLDQFPALYLRIENYAFFGLPRRLAFLTFGLSTESLGSGRGTISFRANLFWSCSIE